MKLLSRFSDFWRGFILGGVTVPLMIVVIEIVVKLILHGKIVWN
ncbi:hypothetical protein [Maridesulfovibrio sp.]